MSDWVRQQMTTLLQIGRLETEQRRQATELRQVTARVEAIEGAHDWFSALAYAKLNDLPTERTSLQCVGARAGRILRDAGRVFWMLTRDRADKARCVACGQTYTGLDLVRLGVNKEIAG